MNRHHAFIGSLVVMFAAAGCAAPRSGPATQWADSEHTARNALDWAGAYHGVLPCADCAGIETVVILASDGTYRTQSKYEGKDSQIFSAAGKFTWNAAGNTIALEGREAAKYFVGENSLTRLALDGSRITGPNAEHYILRKMPTP